MTHYTSIEQSKHLLDFGFSPESADMYYHCLKETNAAISSVPFVKDETEVENSAYDALYYRIPCWSLEALLDLMPPYLFEWERGIDLNIYRNLNGKGWHVSYMPNNINDMQKDKFRQITNGDTLIEAAYNMVVWLVENEYIKKGT